MTPARALPFKLHTVVEVDATREGQMDLVSEVRLRVEETLAEVKAERKRIAGGMSSDEVHHIFGVL